MSGCKCKNLRIIGRRKRGTRDGLKINSRDQNQFVWFLRRETKKTIENSFLDILYPSPLSQMTIENNHHKRKRGMFDDKLKFV